MYIPLLEKYYAQISVRGDPANRDGGECPSFLTLIVWLLSYHHRLNPNLCRGHIKSIDYHQSIIFCHGIGSSYRIKSKGGSSSEKAEVVVVDPMAIFHKALENCMPVLGTSGVRRGGKLYHVSTI